MTKPFNSQFHCSNCNTWQTQESLFGRWIRNNPYLDSGSGYAVTDQDYWIHRYKTFRGREFQLLIGVEVKTMGAALSDSQKDTIHIINQVMRNRRKTPTKNLLWQSGNAPLTVYSFIAKRKIDLRCLGMHVLTFSGLGPQDSEWIKWDSSFIDEKTLTGILAGDLDPDNPSREIDLRSHHAKDEEFFGESINAE